MKKEKKKKIDIKKWIPKYIKIIINLNKKAK